MKTPIHSIVRSVGSLALSYFSSGGQPPGEEPQLPRLSVADCLHYTLTLDWTAVDPMAFRFRSTWLRAVMPGIAAVT
ncbi:MAG TPA: hypothetical protein PK640_04625 [Verrucomicrobiota bacterium]|nr:hypothetical protein [Verrucomicrobiota bacterium]